MATIITTTTAIAIQAQVGRAPNMPEPALVVELVVELSADVELRDDVDPGVS
jgi:hypothetical protein